MTRYLLLNDLARAQYTKVRREAGNTRTLAGRPQPQSFLRRLLARWA